MMYINSSKFHSPPPNSKPVQFGGTSSLLFKNLGQVRKDFFYNLQNDTATFQNNALIYQSLILVLARLVAASKSVQKSKGTVDENYRKSEAIKTSLREIGGFSFSFLVLRAIQLFMGRRIARFFGLENYNAIGKFTFKHLRDAFIWTFIKKKPLYQKREYFTPTLKLPQMDSTTHKIIKEKLADNKQCQPNVLFDAIKKQKLSKMEENYTSLQLDRFFKEKASHLSGQARTDQIFRNVRTLHRYVPIVLGSIPAIILSGYTLEHFTQNHSNALAKKVEKWLNSKKQPENEMHIESELHHN